MGKRIVIDPITRIEGHLKIEVEVEDGRVKNAWSSGTMARGFEALLLGKDPRDASYVTSRFCGVCFSVHQMASARALDAAFGAQVPWGGTLLRNLVMGAEYIYDHLVHFYHLSALDYLDVMAIANYTGKDPGLNKVKEKVVGLVQQGDTFPLTPRYQPDEFTVKDPEIVTTAVKHYLDALKMRKTWGSSSVAGHPTTRALWWADSRSFRISTRLLDSGRFWTNWLHLSTRSTSPMWWPLVPGPYSPLPKRVWAAVISTTSHTGASRWTRGQTGSSFSRVSSLALTEARDGNPSIRIGSPSPSDTVGTKRMAQGIPMMAPRFLI